MGAWTKFSEWLILFMNLLLRSDNRSLNLPVSIDPAWSGNKLQSEKLLINLIICKRGEKEREKPSNSTTNNISNRPENRRWGNFVCAEAVCASLFLVNSHRDDLTSTSEASGQKQQRSDNQLIIRLFLEDLCLSSCFSTKQKSIH